MSNGPFKKVSGRRAVQGTSFHRRVIFQPAGGAGVAVATAALFTGPARVTHLAIDYGSGVPATTDILIKAANGSTGSTTLLSRANSSTDLAKTTVGSPLAVDEGRAATAATDGVEGGWFVSDGLYFDIAQADPFVDQTDVIFIDVWYEEMDLLEISLFPAGADGSAAATRLIKTTKAGVIKGIAIDCGAGVPATTDIVVKTDVLDDASGGSTAFTSTDSATDLGTRFCGVGLGNPGIDEGGAAVAATDAIAGGYPFARVIYVTVAQADGYAADEDIYVQLYCTR